MAAFDGCEQYASATAEVWEEQTMTDVPARPTEDVIADLFAPEPEETPAALKQQVAQARADLNDWASAVPADVIDEALAAGFDLESLTRP